MSEKKERELEAWEAIQERQDYITANYNQFDHLLLELFTKSAHYQEEIENLRADLTNPLNIDEIKSVENCIKLMSELVRQMENQRHHLRRLRESLQSTNGS